MRVSASEELIASLARASDRVCACIHYSVSHPWHWPERLQMLALLGEEAGNPFRSWSRMIPPGARPSSSHLYVIPRAAYDKAVWPLMEVSKLSTVFPSMPCSAFFEAAKLRCSVYTLTNKSTISDERIKEIVESAVKHAPSSFNVQSARAVILLKRRA